MTGMTPRSHERGLLHLLKPTFTPLTDAHKRQAKVPVLLGLRAGDGSRRWVLRIHFLCRVLIVVVGGRVAAG